MLFSFHIGVYAVSTGHPYDITSGINLDHLGKVVFARFLHSKVTLSPSILYSL